MDEAVFCCGGLWLPAAAFGTTENPYAAQEAWSAGMLALCLLIALLPLLALAVWATARLIRKKKERL